MNNSCRDCKFWIERSVSLSTWFDGKTPERFGDCTMLGEPGQGWETSSAFHCSSFEVKELK